MKKLPEYQFSKTTEASLVEVNKYLNHKGYAIETVRLYSNYIGLYMEWLDENTLEAELVNYEQIKTFIFQLKKDRSIKYINRLLIAVNHYYEFLGGLQNPVKGLRMKGERRNLQHYFIEFEELERLYQDYEGESHRRKRNKIILGILIYQGITNRELHRLTIDNVDLKSGTIYIKGSRNSNNRKLKLNVHQILDLQEYLLVTRKEMLHSISNGELVGKARRKVAEIDPKIEQQLFFSESGSSKLKNSLTHLFKDVKKMNRPVTSAKVIRNVVLSYWLRNYDVRMVQYMAGHKFVSSTERYDAVNVGELEKELWNYHPLR
jgi:integrase/recombinase XerD